MKLSTMLKNRKALKKYKTYIQHTAAALDMGRKANHPIVLHSIHPESKLPPESYLSIQYSVNSRKLRGPGLYNESAFKGGKLVDAGTGLVRDDAPCLHDLYWTKGFSGEEMGLCDIHNLAFVALCSGKGIVIDGPDKSPDFPALFKKNCLE